MEEESFDQRLKLAKNSTVYAHTMVWIKEVMDDRTKSETHKFWEINNIMDAALRNLNGGEK
jgi:translation initiation factor RLI1